MKASVRMALIVGALLVAGACAHEEKPKPRVPLPLGMTVSPAVSQATQQGAQAYKSGQFDAAKTYFEQAVTGAPDSGEAHYNLGLALYALGDNDQARDHFIEAANLSPGNKVIWDSPALRQYGNPDPVMRKKKGSQEYTNQKPGLGVPPSGMSR